MKNLHRNRDGFSLVELMVVVAIIGVLASLALPRFNTFQAKAKQAEAKMMLDYMHTLQSAYYAEKSAYAALSAQGKGTCSNNDIGFNIQHCDGSRYSYSATIGTGGQTFTGTANSGQPNLINPDCTGTNDIWQVNEVGAITPVSDTAGGCGGGSGTSDGGSSTSGTSDGGSSTSGTSDGGSSDGGTIGGSTGEVVN